MRSRFRGCLLGGAVGDALGAPLEFLSLAEIRRQFGVAGLRDFAPAYGRLGAITDDTQMTLFTAEGMIRSHARAADRGLCSPIAVTAHAYARWLLTQGVVPHAMPFDVERYPGWLYGVRELHRRRAPGNTCLSSLQEKQHSEEYAANDSKGCGAVMRMAPVGLAGWRFGWDTRYTFELGTSLGRLTHGHPSGYLPAGALAVMVQLLLTGCGVAQAAELALESLVAHEGHEETDTAMRRALRLGRDPSPIASVPAELGEGWVGEEALAIGLYCALAASSSEEGLILAANIDGDSDSTASIAGNLLGALNGVGAIPRRWMRELELKKVVARIADDLFDCVDWNLSGPTDEKVSPAARVHYRRYPPN
ncbi:MAG: hypothetical protein A3G80_02405 [Betaproteobacteria bacterium RIFCSPLOWO2_12_FULL_62_13b]|nr:MAG: hypothetical protein A3G80_02405 [Betaproteobacteria bacterium RIFCSPLOWO2_12_FULL_62_13b]